MATVTLKGNTVHTVGDLPKVGQTCPEFSLTKGDLSEAKLSDFKGHKVVLNIFPSIDTPTCAMAVRKFNEKAASLTNVKVLCISADLPFAQKRFCAAEGIENVVSLSSFRHSEFGDKLGVKLSDGPIAGLLSRSVVVLDEQGKVIYTELVPEISHEPNYDKALEAL
jgi:thiol peroxidase